MKRLFTFVLIVLIILSIGITNANAIFDEEEIYGLWYCNTAIGDLYGGFAPHYIMLFEGGIGMAQTTYEEDGNTYFLKWDVENGKYIKIETNEVSGNTQFMALRIDQESGSIILTDVLATGLLSVVQEMEKITDVDPDIYHIYYSKLHSWE